MSSGSDDNRPFADDAPWRLHPRVALRPEPFGALAYHYGNRRLNFLRSPDLVRLVETLGDHPDPRRAFDAQGLEERRWPSFRRALESLARSDFLEPIPADQPTSGPDPVDDHPNNHSNDQSNDHSNDEVTQTS